jgi:hypothetical protein
MHNVITMLPLNLAPLWCWIFPKEQPIWSLHIMTPFSDWHEVISKCAFDVFIHSLLCFVRNFGSLFCQSVIALCCQVSKSIL